MWNLLGMDLSLCLRTVVTGTPGGGCDFYPKLLHEEQLLLGQLARPIGRPLDFPAFRSSKHGTGPTLEAIGKRHQEALTQQTKV